MKTSAIIVFIQTLIISLNICTISQAQENEKTYPELGLVVGMPAFINVLGGYWFEPVGLRLSGMYLNNNTNGLQINLGYKVSEKLEKRHIIGLAFGKSQDQGSDYYYLGPTYDFYKNKFFLEAGISKIMHVNRGDFSSLPFWIIFQIGYVYNFKKK